MVKTYEIIKQEFRVKYRNKINGQTGKLNIVFDSLEEAQDAAELLNETDPTCIHFAIIVVLETKEI